MLRYCSNCRRKVLPDNDGNCPGCRRTDGLGQPEDLRHEEYPEVVLRGQASLPPVCAFCGDPTVEGDVLTWERKSPHATTSELLLPLAGAVIGCLVGGWIGLLVGALAGKLVSPFVLPRQVVSFRLPKCHRCSARKLEQVEVDWDDYCVHARCHRAFEKALALRKHR